MQPAQETEDGLRVQSGAPGDKRGRKPTSLEAATQALDPARVLRLTASIRPFPSSFPNNDCFRSGKVGLEIKDKIIKAILQNPSMPPFLQSKLCLPLPTW